MNVDPNRFMRHFGSSIRNIDQDVKDKLLNSWTCPLHQDTDMSLTVSSGSDKIFSCDNPVCRFHGDAVSLVALARKIPIKEALDLFRPGGEFSDCLKDPLRTEDADAYLGNVYAQSELKAYLSKCKQALRRNPEKACIRPGLSLSSVKLLHPDVGMFVNQDVPPCLAEFKKPKYNKSCLILYPYTKDGEVTRIEVLDTTNPVFRHVVVVTHPNIGVFGEENVYGNKNIICVEKPEIAAVLYSTHALNSTTKPQIVSLQSYPLPESLHNVSFIHIVSTIDAPATVEFLIRTLSAPEVKSGKSPNIKVVYLGCKAIDVSAKELKNIYANASPNSREDVPRAIARQLTAMIKNGQDQRVLDILSKEQVPALVRNLIRTAAVTQIDRKGGFNGCEEETRELIKLLDNTKFSPSSSITLANGKIFNRSQTELTAYHIDGRRELMCNVGITVDSKVLSCDGKEIYNCSVTHADNVPIVTVKLTDNDLRADKLRAAVLNAYSERGCNPYVAFYSIKHYLWKDVISKLAEHCVVAKEIGELGIDSASNINFPEVCVRADGQVVEQSKIFTIPENVLRMYSGIPFEVEANVEPYYWLLSNCNNLFVAAFTLGLMHVVYQATYGLFKPSVVKNHMLRHLFYVETEPGIWQAVFKQLADLFSGCDFTPTINYAKPQDTLESYKQLGCLPIIATVPTLGSKFSAAIDSAKSDIIGLVDTSTAVMTNGKISASYIIPMNEKAVTYQVIDGHSLDQLRQSFIPFLVKFIKEAKIDTSYRSSSIPCLAAYDEACRIFGVDNKLPHDIVMSYFPGIGMTGTDIFCDMMHRLLVDDNDPKLCVVNGKPQNDHSFTRRGQHVFITENYVLISNIVLDILRQSFSRSPRFDHEELVLDMESRGMLRKWEDIDVSIDQNRCIPLTREAWEMKIVRPPINLNEAVKNGTINLAPISNENN